LSHSASFESCDKDAPSKSGTKQLGDGGELNASNFQPLFHVEHAVGGSMEDPLNLWRIVIMTEEYDARYTEPFKQMVQLGLLPGFLEIYIERRFRCELKRRSY
jgi:hypothetical protein